MKKVSAAVIRRRGWILSGFLFVLGVAGAVIALAQWPTEAPAQTTASRYADLMEHREARADVHAEEPAPSVRSLEVPPTPTPTPSVFQAPVDRIRIKSIGVDAQIVTMGLLSDGTMESPPKPELVAWYGFTTKPGLGGNAVLSGHLDYRNYGPAVFANIKKLKPGDEIEIALKDGTVIKYAVTGLKQYPVELVPMREVLAPTPDDSLTLITCGGAWEGVQYSDRLVLRAAKTGVARVVQ